MKRISIYLAATIAGFVFFALGAVAIADAPATPPAFVTDITQSSPMSDQGLAASVTSTAHWLLPVQSAGEATPVEIQVNLTNVGDKALIVPVMDTLTLHVRGPNGRELTTKYGPLRSRIVRPVLIRRGQDFVICLAARLVADVGGTYSLMFEDDSGAQRITSPIVEGKCVFNLTIGNTGGQPERAEKHAAKLRMWSGTITTTDTAVDVRPSRPGDIHRSAYYNYPVPSGIPPAAQQTGAKTSYKAPLYRELVESAPTDTVNNLQATIISDAYLTTPASGDSESATVELCLKNVGNSDLIVPPNYTFTDTVATVLKNEPHGMKATSTGTSSLGWTDDAALLLHPGQSYTVSRKATVKVQQQTIPSFGGTRFRRTKRRWRGDWPTGKSQQIQLPSQGLRRSNKRNLRRIPEDARLWTGTLSTDTVSVSFLPAAK